MNSRLLALLLCTGLFMACHDETPTGPNGDDTAAFKKKCPSPPCDGGGGEDPPPPPVSDPVILFSSAMEANTGGGGCKRGDLQHSMYRMDLSGSFERVFGNDLESQAHTMSPSFSPDGERFAMSRDVYTVAKGRCATEHFQIAVADLDGSEFHVVRESERGSAIVDLPKWSPAPNGGFERIAWREWNDGVNSVVVARVDGSEATPVITSTAPEQLWTFAWSGSAEQLLVYFESDSRLSALRLYSVACGSSCIATSATDLGNLSPIPADAWLGAMDWAHLGDWVAVTACASGNCDIYKINVANPASPVVTQLTNNGLDENEVVWSPDDSKILFTAWPVDGSRAAIELDLATATLPWNGEVAAPGVRVLADVGNSWGTDWRP